MVYSTMEAFVEEEKIIFKDKTFIPKTRTRVLVTFIEEENDYNLYELDKDDITNELLELSQKALQKDKNLFTNI